MDRSVTIPTPALYERLDGSGVLRWLAARTFLSERLGGLPGEWRVHEVSDGNLNSVYIVKGPAGGVCVKQALPFVRVVGESWPMPLERAYFEQLYLQNSGPHVSGLAPALLHYDPQCFAIAMELLSEHVTLRQELIKGRTYPAAARAVARHVARRSFATSVFFEPFERVNARLAEFSRNVALTRITVDLIFTHPYLSNERNRWTSPQLDDTVAALRADAGLKSAVARLGYRFLTVHEALLHGDLHTGSVMVSQTDTRVIDAEFSTYGPIGFDLGLFVGNLLMAYLSGPGHEVRKGDRAQHGEWVLTQIEEFWEEFVTQVDELWRCKRAGDAFPDSFFATQPEPHASVLERRSWLDSVWSDIVGYAGTEIIRRIVGFAHNADFEMIGGPDLRGALERCSLALARKLIVDPGRYRNAHALVTEVRRISEECNIP